MRPLSVVVVVAVSSLLLLACEGPKGPAGPVGPVGLTGPAGPAGPSLQVVSEEGTVLSRNYTEANDSFISIPLGQDGVNEPVVLLVGLENANGVFVEWEESKSVIWGGTEARFTVAGTSGWYVLLSDPNKNLLNRNYQVKFVWDEP
jgi:hypothetical protein